MKYERLEIEVVECDIEDRYKVTMDSFGENCPKNWEEIASFLNPIMAAEIARIGEDAPDWEKQDVTDKVWEAFCNGEIDACPEPVFEED